MKEATWQRTHKRMITKYLQDKHGWSADNFVMIDWKSLDGIFADLTTITHFLSVSEFTSDCPPKHD